jgi:hypothetical protein
MYPAGWSCKWTEYQDSVSGVPGSSGKGSKEDRIAWWAGSALGGSFFEQANDNIARIAGMTARQLTPEVLCLFPITGLP